LLSDAGHLKLIDFGTS